MKLIFNFGGLYLEFLMDTIGDDRYTFDLYCLWDQHYEGTKMFMDFIDIGSITKEITIKKL